MELDPDLIDWLLDGDAAVCWQVHRDLLDADPSTVAAQRARVATSGWGARLLAEQAADGTWGRSLYSPKWTSTTYTLLLLRQLGLDSDDPRALAGCMRLLDGARWFDGGLDLGRSARIPEVCVTAIVASLASAFAVTDDRVDAAFTWLLHQQLDDGGWNCESIRSGSIHGSFDTTILTLEALHYRQAQVGPDPAREAAAARGRGFFAAHRLYCSHRTGEVVNRAYTRMVFPPGWHHDLLRGLDHFQAVGADPEPRLTEPIARLRAKRRTDGTWTTNARHPGRHWFEIEAAGRPSRMNTLRALRVLRWWDQSRGDASTSARGLASSAEASP